MGFPTLVVNLIITSCLFFCTGSESESDLEQLEKMKAELMARLEGDFKLSPEEEESDSDGEIST